ncbi:MAG TPA: hypothetical protein GX503_05695 [Clostridiales bacterium]|nr:hypothetical protein [Clostridiales bacterium]
MNDRSAWTWEIQVDEDRVYRKDRRVPCGACSAPIEVLQNRKRLQVQRKPKRAN